MSAEHNDFGAKRGPKVDGFGHFKSTLRLWPMSGLLLSLTACDPLLPPPAISSIAPTTTLASSPVQLELQVDAVLPYAVDYGARSAGVDAAVQVNLGPLRLYRGTWPENGAFFL